MATDVIKCKYFPALPARWYCPKCKVNMANECAKLPKSPSSDKRLCPLCESELASLGIGNSIKPFWERIPKFFAYPAKIDSLIYLGLLSLGVLLGMFIPKFGIGIYILALFGTLNFASKCLFLSAQGNLSPPTVLAHVDTGYRSIALKFFGIFAFTMLVIAAAFRFNVFLGYATAGFSLLSLPAAIIILAMSGSFFDSLNLTKVVNIMMGMGKSYLLLYVLLMLMSGSSGLIEHLAAGIVNKFFLLPFLFFINSYFMVAMFSMMGYALYQYHEKFGFEGVAEANLAEEGVDIKASGISQDPFLNEIHILLSEGLFDEAGIRLKKRLITHSANLQYHDKYHNLLKITQNQKELSEHTASYMKLLYGQERVNKALLITVYAECIKANPDFFYPDAAKTVDLAKTAQELHRYQDALTILANFSKHYPGHEQIPYAYIIVAQLLSEQRQQDEQAKKILLSLLAKYPDHELIPQIKVYLQVIENMAK